jgi:chloride channel protein, CIC family
VPVSPPFQRFLPSRTWLNPKPLAMLEAVAIGMVAALAAVILKQGVVVLGDWRISDSLSYPTWVLLPAVGLGGGLLAGLLVEKLAPETAGSGIPQVKAALAYKPIALDLRVALVKLLTSLLTLSSGFVLGRQGPTVQIGAALAAQLSRWVPASPEHQRQLIAAGAAAGLAAGFDAPIAGIMFVIEELLQDVSSLTLGTAILASFTGGVVSRLLGGESFQLGINPAEFPASFSLPELPFFLLVGGIAGVWAALFNRGIVTTLQWSRQRLRWSLALKMGGAGLFAGGVAAALPAALRDTTLMQVFLTDGAASWQMTLLAFGVQFALTLMACSAEAPGGLFTPSLILGAAVGHTVGLLADTVLEVSPITYALAGMGAFFGAVAKVPVTAIVIVFEMTTNFRLVLPLMIAVVTAYLVADKLAPGSLYTQLLELKGIHLEPTPINDGLWARLTAADVMQTRVQTLESDLPAEEVIQAFSRSHHRGFPVVAEGWLVGIVTQSDLDRIANFAAPPRLRDLMTPHPITVSPTDSLSQVLHLLSQYKLSRLPVTEGRRLVGIITRSDILRVEAEKLRGDTPEIRPTPSYSVYRTQSPALGKGRLLLPLSNPQTAHGLLRMALAIAQEYDYEIECLHVITVPSHSPPSETAVRTTQGRRLLSQAIQQAQRWDIPIHTQIRVAHQVDYTILEVIKARHIDLLLTGWKGSTSTPDRIFGTVVDALITHAPCDLVLVKMGKGFGTQDLDFSAVGTATRAEPPAMQALWQLLAMNRWLVPVAGGPNSHYAIQLLPALLGLCKDPEVSLCQVFHSAGEPDTLALEAEATALEEKLQRSVTRLAVCARSIPEAVVDMARQEGSDVVVVGATREGLLQQAIHGNIPETIARQCDCTVILVRKAIDPASP